MPSLSPKPAEIASDLLSHRLGALRAELDRVDDALHDLLMRRAEIVTEVGALRAKGNVPLRPGREASIIRRLLARNRGALAPSAIVRIWRELLAGSSAQQTPMAIAAADPALVPLAREHFGALTPIAVSPAESVLRDVRAGTTTVAVLPIPGADERWWLSLLDPTQPPIRVVARLPFWARQGAPAALVVTAAEPDPSGADHTLIAGPAAPPGSTIVAQADGLVLAELPGFIEAGDPCLPPGAVILGAYAIPVGDIP